MRIAGIDPGSKGAIAVLDPEARTLAVFNMPLIVREGTSRTIRNADGDGIRDILEGHGVAQSYLEEVHSLPTDGHVGAFSFGDNFGTIKGVHAGLRIPLKKVPPQTWKKTLRVPADKAKAVERAKELFPACADLFTRSDRAEAAMIGLYGMLLSGVTVKGKFIPAA